MNLTSRYLIQVLEENGFIFKRSKGSHHLYFNPLNFKTIVVPVHEEKI